MYLDETWYDTYDTISKGWADNIGNCYLETPLTRGKRLIILHASSEKRIVVCCYRERTLQIFEKINYQII